MESRLFRPTPADALPPQGLQGVGSGRLNKNTWEKNGERGKLGQERLEVGWEVVMFLFNIVNLNV